MCAQGCKGMPGRLASKNWPRSLRSGTWHLPILWLEWSWGQGEVWDDAGLSLHHTKANAENMVFFKSPIPALAQGQGTPGNNELGPARKMVWKHMLLVANGWDTGHICQTGVVVMQNQRFPHKPHWAGLSAGGEQERYRKFSQTLSSRL